MRSSRGLAGVLAVLMATGWAANHFSAVIPVLAEDQGHSDALLDGAFGVYALGLVPGLFGGGALSDRLGRVLVVLPGALLAALGTGVLLFSHEPLGLYVGRFVVGLGAGLTFGAGTAWAADLGETTGTVLAGVFLTSGFGVGPLVSGAVAHWAQYPLETPFVVSLVLSLVTVAVACLTAVPATRLLEPAVSGTAPDAAPGSPAAALAWSLPIGLLVFAGATVPLVTLPRRLPDGYGGPLLVGLSCALCLGAGIAVQAAARARHWGPRTGVVGALLCALGFATAALAGAEIGFPAWALSCVVLGSSYGLCLREGLLDVETLAPAARRGLLTGAFYVVTYIGFGLPLLVELLSGPLGPSGPLAACAVVALLVAVTRVRQIGSGHPAR